MKNLIIKHAPVKSQYPLIPETWFQFLSGVESPERLSPLGILGISEYIFRNNIVMLIVLYFG